MKNNVIYRKNYSTNIHIWTRPQQRKTSWLLYSKCKTSLQILSLIDCFGLGKVNFRKRGHLTDITNSRKRPHRSSAECIDVMTISCKKALYWHVLWLILLIYTKESYSFGIREMEKRPKQTYRPTAQQSYIMYPIYRETFLFMLAISGMMLSLYFCISMTFCYQDFYFLPLPSSPMSTRRVIGVWLISW